MKSIEDLYKEIQSNEELKKEFVTSFKEGKVEEFLKAHDCDASATDVIAFMESQRDEIASEDDLEKVAGGSCSPSYTCHGCSNNCTDLNDSGLGMCP